MQRHVPKKQFPKQTREITDLFITLQVKPKQQKYTDEHSEKGLKEELAQSCLTSRKFPKPFLSQETFRIEMPIM